MATAKKASAKKATTVGARAKLPAEKRMGRPPKPEADRRTARIGLRLHPAEREELEAEAEAEGVTVTQLVLEAVRQLRARRAR